MGLFIRRRNHERIILRRPGQPDEMIAVRIEKRNCDVYPTVGVYLDVNDDTEVIREELVANWRGRKQEDDTKSSSTVEATD